MLPVVVLLSLACGAVLDLALGPLTGKRIHRAGEIPVYAFDRAAIDAAVAALDRRNTAVVSVTEQQLYLTLNGTDVLPP